MALVIAEIGINHGGIIENAYRLAYGAKKAGADAVKFQAYTPERLDPPGAWRDMLARLYLGRSEFELLSGYCRELDIEFMATPFGPEWVEPLVELGVKRMKVASGSLGDKELLAAVARTKLPVILSTGLTNEHELIDAVCAIKTLSGSHLTLLHCVSAYPTAIENMNLRRMERLGQAFRNFGVGVGLSDHSTSIYMPIAAVAMGAEVIEKHITLDRSGNGPDHKSSLEPDEFARMVDGIRSVGLAMGDGELFAPPPDPGVMAIKEARDAWRMRD